MELVQSTGSGSNSIKSQNISDVSHISNSNEFSGSLMLIILPCLIFQQQMFVGLQLTFMHSFMVPSGHPVAVFQG